MILIKFFIMVHFFLRTIKQGECLKSPFVNLRVNITKEHKG